MLSDHHIWGVALFGITDLNQYLEKMNTTTRIILIRIHTLREKEYRNISITPAATNSFRYYTISYKDFNHRL